MIFTSLVDHLKNCHPKPLVSDDYSGEEIWGDNSSRGDVCGDDSLGGESWGNDFSGGKV